MAHIRAFFPLSLCAFLCYLPLVLSQPEFSPTTATYVTIDSCASQNVQQYYNPITLQCANCRANSTRSADGLTCVCPPGFRKVKDFGGGLVTCEPCADYEVVSEDGWECLNCSTGIDPDSRQCIACSNRQIEVTRSLDGNFFTPDTVTCTSCSDDTIPNADKNRCERCSVSLSISSTSSCACDPDSEYRGICFKATDPPSGPNLYTITLNNNIQEQSLYMSENLLADYYLCKDHFDQKACQSLANMCAMIMYNGIHQITSRSLVCPLMLSLLDPAHSMVMPQTVINDPADRVITSKDITTQWTVEPATIFPMIVGIYDLSGNFEGYQDIDGSFLQLCKNTSENVLNAAFVFATYYSYSCTISARNLWDGNRYPLKLYELFIKYTDEGEEKVHRIPIKINNYREGAALINQGPVDEWKLVRRFFLVDNQMLKPDARTDAPIIRYASNIIMHVELQSTNGDGRIYAPYLEITYSDVPIENMDTKVPSSFEVTYSVNQFNNLRNLQIAAGTLSTIAVIYAGYRTYVWNKRAGRLTIDFQTLINFFFYLCNYLGGSFFVVTFGIGFYFYIFFKRQNVVYLVHPEGEFYEVWLALFGTAFALRCLSLIHMIVMQCSADIFLVDWERPKGQQVKPIGDQENPKKKSGNEVSIWRTYFVANEWNELQTVRKINRVFQIFAVVFFLHVVEFEDTTTKDPDGTVGKADDIYMAEQSPMFRMALATLVYILVDVVQVFFFVFIYERFFTDDIREFVDLCSMSNVSVFIMAHAEFGYYIHGRSVHGRSDVGMREMSEMLEREVNDLVGKRGLVPQTEPQTFIMALPKRLRQRYETVYMPVQLENATPAGRAEQSRAGGKEKTVEAYGMLNRFFCAFIDHSLRDVDYVVKEKSFLEKVLDTEFLELTDKGIFYSDNGHSFDNSLFYGNELTLVVFDALLFCIIDLIFQNFVLAGILTYIIIELICLARDTEGTKNLARKTLVDKRFLI